MRPGCDSDQETRAVAGSLNRYSGVLQTGRMHLRSWWEYWRDGRNRNPPLHLQLYADTQWWIHVLSSWSLKGVSLWRRVSDSIGECCVEEPKLHNGSAVRRVGDGWNGLLLWRGTR